MTWTSQDTVDMLKGAFKDANLQFYYSKYVQVGHESKTVRSYWELLVQ